MNMKRILKAALGLSLLAALSAPVAASAIECGGLTLLYDGDNLAGNMVGVGPRNYVVNLSYFNFNNRTNSVHTGRCGVTLYTGPNGTGSTVWVPAHSDVTLTWWQKNIASSILLDT